MNKHDLCKALRAEVAEADAKADQFRATLKYQHQQVEYWQEQAKCARGLLHRLEVEARNEDKTDAKT